MKCYAQHNKKRKNRSSRITASTLFTRLQQAFKLKFAPLFAPLINLLKQTYYCSINFLLIIPLLFSISSRYIPLL